MQSDQSAIKFLKAEQAKYRKLLGLDPKLTEEEVLELALKQAKKREEQSVRNGQYIRESCFRYPASLEQLRWQQTRDVIRRVAPGMDEDPVYLEMLAREAASIEIVLCQKDTGSPNPKASALCERIVLGTTVKLQPEAGMWYSGKWDRFLVVLSYGFISFLYQAAKAVVLSNRIMEPQPGSRVGFSDQTEDILYVLDKDPSPIELLYKTLYTYMFKGYPRAVFNDTPPPCYHPPLGLLANYIERFVIAHEYGHALMHQLGVKIDPNWQVIPSWQEEFVADSLGFLWTMESAEKLDSVAPNMAFRGVLFSLSGLEIIFKTLDIIRHGSSQRDEGSETHPPIQRRISALKEGYRQHVGRDVRYTLPFDGKLGRSKTIDLSIEGALGPSNALNLMWDRIQNRFLEANRQKSEVHHIWG